MPRTLAQIRVARANRNFRRMSRAERRVAIAKDALAQINAGVYSPGHTYCWIRKGSIASPKSKPTDQVLSTMKIRHCQVCARGALFLSSLRVFNHCTVSQLGADVGSSVSSFTMAKTTEKLHFSKAQIELIEGTFEGWTDNDRARYNFVSKYSNNKDRLEAILRNIIANKGTFRP